MSVFRVKLNNVNQGLLDKNPATASAGSIVGQGLGGQMNPSIQRGVYITGPNRINRLLTDGETFTDCNYWKRFASPQVSFENAFIEVVTDDGSIYSDIASENTYPRVFDIDATAGTTFTDNQADIVGDTGGYAVFAQITNNGSEDVRIRLNGLTTAVFDLPSSSSQIFDKGDLSISLIEVDHSASGASSTVAVQVITSVRSVCHS